MKEKNSLYTENDFSQAISRLTRDVDIQDAQSFTIPLRSLEERIERSIVMLNKSNVAVLQRMYLERIVELLHKKIKRDYCS